MNVKRCVETLKKDGDIPEDSEVVSTNNKVVVISHSEMFVGRISDLLDLSSRDDPQDVRYSHDISWAIGDITPVVKPINKNPSINNNYVISSYPLLNREVDLNKSKAKEIFNMIQNINNTLSHDTPISKLRQLSIDSYVKERLDYMCDNPIYDQRLLNYIYKTAYYMEDRYPFNQLTQSSASLIHGDLKTNNVVLDYKNNLKAIDLDAAAIGPRLYDLASWRLRCETEDNAPIEDVVNIGRQTDSWNEEVYRSLIGWKAISSMSFSLRYEAAEIYRKKIMHLAKSAVLLGGLENIPAIID